jgi:hypothetical protein
MASRIEAGCGEKKRSVPAIVFRLLFEVALLLAKSAVQLAMFIFARLLLVSFVITLIVAIASIETRILSCGCWWPLVRWAGDPVFFLRSFW